MALRLPYERLSFYTIRLSPPVKTAKRANTLSQTLQRTLVSFSISYSPQLRPLRSSIRIMRIPSLLIDDTAQTTTQTAASSGIVDTTATTRTPTSPAIEITTIWTPQSRALYAGNRTVDP